MLLITVHESSIVNRGAAYVAELRFIFKLKNTLPIEFENAEG
jgi:hypothetical protein